MKPSRQQRVCKALCCSCNCRLSVSSSSEILEVAENNSSSSSSANSHRFPSVSSLAHAMVQERLDQMIRSDQRERETKHHYHHYRHNHHHHQNLKKPRERDSDEEDGGGGTKFVVMMAMEKSSYDPREDFRESMVEMIMTNRLQNAKELRSLLNYYVSMNSQEYHGLILEVFHEVCTNLFLASSSSSCKCRYW